MSLRKSRRIGKSQARANFLPLVRAVAEGSGPVEITDRGDVVAVLLGREDFLWLLAHTTEQPRLSSSLAGSMALNGDLEEADLEISTLFRQSLEQTAREL